MKKRNHFRWLAIFLSSVMTLSLFAPWVSARKTEDNLLTVSQTNFLSKSAFASGGTAELTDEQAVRLNVTDPRPSLSMTITPIAAVTRANALRIVLENKTACNEMVVEYVFKNSANSSETGKTTVKLEPYAGKKEYIFRVTSPDTMTALTLTFPCDGSGSVTVFSVGAVSYVFEEENLRGKITIAEYNGKTSEGRFAGEVDYNTTLVNRDSTIVLYKLEPDESISDVRPVHKKTAECPMTLNFDFTFPVEGLRDACARYFVAMLTSDREVIPLTGERYLSETVIKGEELPAVGFKGVETSLYIGASECEPAVALVDVFINRLPASGNNGFQFAVAGEEYYFNRDEVIALDKEIQTLKNVGAAVYLRYLAGTEPDHKTDAAPDMRKPGETERLYACTAFLLSRYSSPDGSGVRGVIIGRALNEPELSREQTPLALAEYADQLAQTCSVIRRAADTVFQKLEIVLPVQEADFGYDLPVTAETRDYRYPLDLLLQSVALRLTHYGTASSSLYFMLESTRLTWPTKEQPVLPTEGYAKFADLVQSLSKLKKELPSKFLTCWYPDIGLAEGDILTAYLSYYNLVAHLYEVRTCIVSFLDADEREAALFSAFRDAFKYADSYRNAEIGKDIPTKLEVASWQDIVRGFNSKRVIRRRLEQPSMIYDEEPFDISGSYALWDFSKANASLGWNAGDGCDALSVYTAAQNTSRSLVAHLAPDASLGAEFGSIVYYTDGALFLNNIDCLCFEIFLPDSAGENGTKGSVYEVAIAVRSDDLLVESVGVMNSGSVRRLYVDVRSATSVDSIRLSFRNLSAGAMDQSFYACVNKISILSEVYSNADLEKKVLSGELSRENTSEAKKNQKKELLTVGLLVGISAGVVMVAGGVYHWQKKRNARRAENR